MRTRELIQIKIASLRAPQRSNPVTRDPMTLSSLRGMSAGHGSLFTDERKKKIGAFAIVTLLVIGGGMWLYHARQFAAEQDLWNTTLNQAIDRKNRAEGDLVYNNEDRARRLLKEASDLVASLDENTTDRKTAKEKFVKDLKEVQNKLKREVRIDQPAEVFTSATSEKVYARSRSQMTIVSVDPANNTLVLVSPTTKASKTLALPAKVSGD